MNKKEPLDLTNEDLIAKAGKIKFDSIINAVFIGFLLGIIFLYLDNQTFSIFNPDPIVHYL